MADRNRTRQDDKGMMFQVKGKLTRKVINAQKRGEVDLKDTTNREGGATRTNRAGK